MKSLHIRVQVGPMWRDHIGFDPDTEQKADQCRRKIAPGRASDEAGIIIEGEHVRPAMFTQKLGHHLQQDFGIEIRSDLSMQPDRGTGIDKVGDLHDMLLLADHGSAGTLVASFRSNWTSSPGLRRSSGWVLRRRSSGIHPA